jgi:hypothetical protein
VHEYPRNKQKPPLEHTNPIVPEGGFLQVAVSKAPVDSSTEASSSLVGASDTALRLKGSYSARQVSDMVTTRQHGSVDATLAALEHWIVLLLTRVPPLGCEVGGGLSELNQGVTRLMCGRIVARE